MLLFGLVRRLLTWVVLLSVVVVALAAGRIWWVARQDDRPRSDAIVVLGAAQFDGRPSAIFRARLNHAKALYDAGIAPVVVTVGGGQPGDRTTEAQAGASYLQQRQVETVAVATGRDTVSSLRALRLEFDKRGWKSAVIVTDPWHSLRSRSIAKDQGINAAASPARSGPAVRTRATQFRYITRETGAYLHYLLFRSSSDTDVPDAV